MKSLICYAAGLLCVLVLTGCNISTTTLGAGAIILTSSNADTCANQANCFDGGYNRAVTFRAEPAADYEFSGWAGACEGMGECTVYTLGNRHVIATFKSREVIVPLMHYTQDFFFSGPWPSDTRRHKSGTLELDDYPQDKGLLYSKVKSAASTMKGYARNGTLYIPLSTIVDDSNAGFTYFEGDSTDAVQLINLNPQSSHYGELTPLTLGLVHDTNLAKDSLLTVRPSLAASLEPATAYGLILFENTGTSRLPKPVQASAEMRALAATGGSGLLGQHWQQIKQIVEQQTPFSPEQVAAFSVFTTQDDPAVYAQLRDYYARFQQNTDFSNVRHGIYPDSIYGYQAFINCDTTTPNPVRTFIFEADLPNFQAGKPPYTAQGGNFKYDANGKLTTAGNTTRTRFVVVEPCEPAPAQGWPLEIVAAPTRIDTNFYPYLIDEHGTESHRAIQVILPAPYTYDINGYGDRSYSSGIENLSRWTNLFGIDTDILSGLLADANPLNLQSILPTHVQYASDMLYALNFMRDYPAYLAQHPLELEWPDDFVNDFAQLRFDTRQIAFRGESLGGVAALHASAISGENSTVIVASVPRTNIYHVNNLVEYLREIAGDSVVNIIELIAGVHFPIAVDSPFATLMQTAIDPIDVNNRIQDLDDKNVYVGLSEFNDKLHGQETSYSFAAALNERLPTTLVDDNAGSVPGSSNAEWNLASIYYLGDMPYAGYGDIVEGKPTRIITRFGLSEMKDLANNFLHQMATNPDLDTGLTIY